MSALHPNVAAWIPQGNAGGYWAVLGWLVPSPAAPAAKIRRAAAVMLIRRLHLSAVQYQRRSSCVRPR